MVLDVLEVPRAFQHAVHLLFESKITIPAGYFMPANVQDEAKVNCAAYEATTWSCGRNRSH